MNTVLDLKEALFPLKESSKSAIADAASESFDQITKYLHLDRIIEGQLREFLESVKKSDSKKLFLICGNVGDGKSHLLASIRISQPELLDGIILHNDATESSEPDATFIDELNSLLAPFSDLNLTQGNEKIVLAVNLGTLNNFLSADEDNRFSKLEAYVRDNNILEVGEIVECQFDEHSPFQFVNFCDHNLFYLTENGPVSKIIETAIERVVSPAGPFYEAYEEQKIRSPKNCPVCFNFAMLQSEVIRKEISSLLIECIIRGEFSLSIRALYNFIYELIIPIDLEPLNSQAVIKRINSYSSADFLSNIIPNYIFSHPELSPIFEQIQKLDPAKRRTEIIDDTIIELMVSAAPFKVVSKYLPLDMINDDFTQTLHDSSSDATYINTFIRTTYFWKQPDTTLFQKTKYDSYMELMFGWHSGNGKTLKPLYKLVQQAITSWKGQTEQGQINVNVGRQQLEYRTSEEIIIKPDPFHPPNVVTDNVNQLNTFLPVRFKADGRQISLKVTYNLYALFCKIQKGYRATSLDHSNFVVFDDFVQKIARAGEGHKKMFFTESSSKNQFVLELDNFGDFCFNEVVV